MTNTRLGDPPGQADSDDALLRSVYEQHGGAVLAYATRLTGDRAAAEDILQETLVRAWRHRDVLVNGRGSVRAWMMTVAGRIVVDRARARGSRPREVAEVPGVEPMTRDHADQFVDSTEMFEALQKLSQEQRDAIVYLYFRGCNMAEAALALGVPEGTVRSRVHYGVLALRKIFPRLRTAATEAAR